MTIGRRDLMLGGLGAVLAVAAGPRKAAWRGRALCGVRLSGYCYRQQHRRHRGDGHLGHQFQRGRPPCCRAGQSYPLPQGRHARGVGIAVEADSVVSGNVVEGAPGCGIVVGWGGYLRDVSVTGNLIRESQIGVGVSADSLADTALITDNLITDAKGGAIRAMNGSSAIGPDFASASADAYSNLVVSSNVAR
jgi:putative cofactor-binding repeat protein